jgi:hypothetical protein
MTKKMGDLLLGAGEGARAEKSKVAQSEQSACFFIYVKCIERVTSLLLAPSEDVFSWAHPEPSA